mmetsp:Transcript_8790/g.30010  ORF Transcript_8790/g.30010 Transcript_8790/m.30010 type:complete len:221 (-) Transcript_8790:1293-1955(-)
MATSRTTCSSSSAICARIAPPWSCHGCRSSTTWASSAPTSALFTAEGRASTCPRCPSSSHLLCGSRAWPATARRTCRRPASRSPLPRASGARSSRCPRPARTTSPPSATSSTPRSPWRSLPWRPSRKRCGRTATTPGSCTPRTASRSTRCSCAPEDSRGSWWSRTSSRRREWCSRASAANRTRACSWAAGFPSVATGWTCASWTLRPAWTLARTAWARYG